MGLMRIFIGVQEIAGYFASLEYGFKKMGNDCRFVSFTDHPFTYGENEKPGVLSGLIRRLNRYRATAAGSLLGKAVGALVQLLKIPVFLWACARFDIFIFGFASTFFGRRDLPLLKFLGKKIVFVFLGSDSRPPYVDGTSINSDNEIPMEELARITARKKSELRQIEKYADVIVNYPPMALFHEKKYVCGLCLGFPFNSPEPVLSTSRGKPIPRVLHCPSSRAVKGTAEIRRIVDSLKTKGHKFDYVELSGRPHSEVLRELAECDFVIDQMYSDTPLAGFATEAAFSGKPAVIGGYYADHIAREMPADMIPPSIFVHPDKVGEAIEKLLTDEEYRKQAGAAVRDFVCRNWTPEKVAARYLKIIDRDIPQDWIFDPNDIVYFKGAGVGEIRLQETVSNLLSACGRESLQLADKPELERAIAAFTEEKSS
jgi:glycosyltransferase involved in cell wall biosynthesis